ncbi:MAG: hypothetical protein ABI073_08950 [Luteolibacter sp.]
MNQRLAIYTLAVINLVSYALLGFASWMIHGNSHREFWITVSVGVFGVLCGWFIGFLASPSTGTENKRFSRYGGLISTFMSGYLLSKLDPMLVKFLKKIEFGASPDLGFNVLIFLSCLISGAMIMYIVRSYFHRLAKAGAQASTQASTPAP